MLTELTQMASCSRHLLASQIHIQHWTVDILLASNQKGDFSHKYIGIT